jgi:acetyltransferase-like isoleucine patch superfamily enzyme
MLRDSVLKTLTFLPPRVRARLGRRLYDAVRYRDGRRSRSIRNLALSMQGSRLGREVRIGRDVTVNDAAGLAMGNGVSIQERCYLSATGGITIGDEVSMGQGTSIVSSTHPFDTSPIRRNPIAKAAVVIGSDVWIGMGASILGGVTIGDHVVVGAMSLVNKDIPSGVVVAGIPARQIKRIRDA